MLRAASGATEESPCFASPMVQQLHQDLDTLEDGYEPFLIMEGYLQRTPQGRTATELGYQRLGLKPEGGPQQSLL